MSTVYGMRDRWTGEVRWFGDDVKVRNQARAVVAREYAMKLVEHAGIPKSDARWRASNIVEPIEGEVTEVES